MMMSLTVTKKSLRREKATVYILDVTEMRKTDGLAVCR
jgi:hypothetical protein